MQPIFQGGQCVGATAGAIGESLDDNRRFGAVLQLLGIVVEFPAVLVVEAQFVWCERNISLG